jgi:hypothetical protein
VAQGVGPEFKPQYHKKKKKDNEPGRKINLGPYLTTYTKCNSKWVKNKWKRQNFRSLKRI